MTARDWFCRMWGAFIDWLLGPETETPQYEPEEFWG